MMMPASEVSKMTCSCCSLSLSASWAACSSVMSWATPRNMGALLGAAMADPFATNRRQDPSAWRTR